MKWLSFNCRGLAISPKNLALRILFESEPVEIIILQEMLGLVDHIYCVLQSLKPEWNFQSLDVMGRSGGLALGFNPCTIHLKACWGGAGFIGMDNFSIYFGMDLRIVNIYGPFHNKEAFWNHLLNLSIINSDNIILGGDLNFSIGFGESWGTNSEVDPLSYIIEKFLEEHHLM